MKNEWNLKISSISKGVKHLLWCVPLPKMNLKYFIVDCCLNGSVTYEENSEAVGAEPNGK